MFTIQCARTDLVSYTSGHCVQMDPDLFDLRNPKKLHQLECAKQSNAGGLTPFKAPVIAFLTACSTSRA